MHVYGSCSMHEIIFLRRGGVLVVPRSALRNNFGRWRSEPSASEPGVRAILDPCVAGFDRFEFKFRPKRSDFGRKKAKSQFTMIATTTHDARRYCTPNWLG